MAARREGVKDLGGDGLVGLEACYDGAGVDVVEGLVEGPLLFGVGYLEAAVGGDAAIVSMRQYLVADHSAQRPTNPAVWDSGLYRVPWLRDAPGLLWVSTSCQHGIKLRTVFNGPDTGARRQVQHALGVGNWRHVQAIV